MDEIDRSNRIKARDESFGEADKEFRAVRLQLLSLLVIRMVAHTNSWVGATCWVKGIPL